MLKQSRRLVAALAVALGAAACSDVPTAPEAAPRPVQAAKGAAGEKIPGRFIVVFRGEVQDAPGLARRLAAESRATVHHTYQHAIKGFAATLNPQAVEALRRNPNVAYVEQDQIVLPVQAGSWGLDRIDQRDLPLNGVYGYTQTGAGVNAYVIDTGIETSHWEFGGRAYVGYDAIGDGWNGQDCWGHGTHVAGTIGGANYGVAKSANLISVRVFNCNTGSPWSTIIAGIDWVRYYHAKPAVANLSLSGGASQAADDAVADLVAAGVTVAVAAGNDGWDACNNSPARAPSVLTVGATNSSDARAYFSNYGACVDLFAAGDGITSAWLYGGTTSISGTSMASPHVAGAAALYLQANPYAAPSTVNSAIVSNATPWRLTDVLGAPNLLLFTGATTSGPAPLAASISGPSEVYAPTTDTWYATASGGGGTYSYQWQYRTGTGTWANVGTNSPSYTRSIGTLARTFQLRVIVTSAGASVTSATYFVTVYREPTCGEYAC